MSYIMYYSVPNLKQRETKMKNAAEGVVIRIFVTMGTFYENLQIFVTMKIYATNHIYATHHSNIFAVSFLPLNQREYIGVRIW